MLSTVVEQHTNLPNARRRSSLSGRVSCPVHPGLKPWAVLYSRVAAVFVHAFPYADTPTRRHADTPTHPHAGTPTRRHALSSPNRIKLSAVARTASSLERG